MIACFVLPGLVALGLQASVRSATTYCRASLTLYLITWWVWGPLSPGGGGAISWCCWVDNKTGPDNWTQGTGSWQRTNGWILCEYTSAIWLDTAATFGRHEMACCNYYPLPNVCIITTCNRVCQFVLCLSSPYNRVHPLAYWVLSPYSRVRISVCLMSVSSAHIIEYISLSNNSGTSARSKLHYIIAGVKSYIKYYMLMKTWWWSINSLSKMNCHSMMWGTQRTT